MNQMHSVFLISLRNGGKDHPYYINLNQRMLPNPSIRPSVCLFAICFLFVFPHYRMEYRVIKSKFGNDLLYVPSEKILYKKKRNDEYVCYQTVLCDNKKKDHAAHPKCSSGIRRLTDNICERLNVHIDHTCHENHETIALDKEKLNNMISNCENLRLNFREDANRIPNRNIFQREVSRYILCVLLRLIQIDYHISFFPLKR